VSGIHATALVSPGAQVGEGSEIGPYTIVHANVRLGANSRVGSHCELGIATPLGDGSPLVIGAGALIRSHSVFYESSVFGAGLVTGHHVAARELTRAGKNLQMGSARDIQGDCAIGDYVRFHRGVHIGRKSVIGNFVWMFPDVLLTNDATPPSDDWKGPVVEDYAVLCARVTLLPGVRIGRDAVVFAHSLVGIDIPAGKMAEGNPAQVRGDATLVRTKDDVRVRAYPWRKRFTRGYPEEVVLAWQTE
jgi:acyl-[acyl carrier protein]--UDP-N-acetylglucosamine O-acyltransferase